MWELMSEQMWEANVSGYVRGAGMSWVNIPAWEDEAMKKLIAVLAVIFSIDAAAAASIENITANTAINFFIASSSQAGMFTQLIPAPLT